MARTPAGLALSANSPVSVTVNVRLSLPRGLVTTSGPVVAPIGTVVVIVVAETERTTAGSPLNVTVVGPGSKWAPLIVTKVPIVPLDGETSLIAGPSSTPNVRLAGVGSSLPARSRAFTSKVCDVSLSPPTVAVVAAENALHGPPSSRQAKSRSAVGVRLSEPVNVNVALAMEITPVGPPVIIVSGGVLSTMTDRVRGALSLPARSVAVTRSVWGPSGALVVFHVAVAVIGEPGGAGDSAGVSGWPAALGVMLATPLPGSVAVAVTVTGPLTKAPEGGAWKARPGAMSSCVMCPVAADEVRPSPPCVVAKTSRLSSVLGTSVIAIEKWPVLSA